VKLQLKNFQSQTQRQVKLQPLENHEGLATQKFKTGSKAASPVKAPKPLFAFTISFPFIFLLKPAATVLCMRSGAPGGLFTPSLTVGALLGAVLGHAWSWLWPGVPPGLFAVLGAGAVLAATTQGPISTVVLMMELTGRYRSFILPLLLVVGTATLVARTIEPRSIYDARLTDEEVEAWQKLREETSQ